jgi:hypothetical protein
MTVTYQGATEPSARSCLITPCRAEAHTRQRTKEH